MIANTVTTIFLVILAIALCANATTEDLQLKIIKEEGSRCQSKFNNRSGTCIKVRQCPSALSLIKINDTQTLKSMLCGFVEENNINHPLVCCSSEGTLITFNDKEEAATTTSRSANATTNATTVVENFTENPQQVIDDIFLSRNVCGQVNVQDNRIHGGVIASIDDFPWLARLNITNRRRPSEVYKCIGSLITDRYIVTAAHCLNDSEIVNVRLGEFDAQTEKDCYEKRCNDKPVDVNSDTYIIHPMYNIITNGIPVADIALIRLNESVNFTDFIQPVCLPNTEYVALQDYILGTTYWTGGWGVTEFGEESLVKRKISLSAVAIDVCKTAIPNIPASLDGNIICAGGKIGEDTCEGDSGGSLVQAITENYVNNWFLLGITSFGRKSCGSPGMPGVYTKVSSYMDWIRDTIRNLEQKKSQQLNSFVPPASVFETKI